ncbi:MAG TPA: bifunctional hydroxymethylpyrimidine kinase/phosphomethylpyrimidine kinase, partial [Opitutales bacterium]|nr:bifunctional hydroxymethylpyrimidine kinase/phosphomethylpyrimidine kinase [Opitutales bacterium]
MPERRLTSSELPVAMTIAGSDSGAGAGIQADLLTFAALGVFGVTAITCLTAQNPSGVRSVHPAPPQFVTDELGSLAAYFHIGAVKTGMLYDSGIINAVCDFLSSRRDLEVVVDPVMVATSGAMLLKPDAAELVKTRLLPLATLVTPNLDEVAVLTGERPTDAASMRGAARRIHEMCGASVLVKGGHLESDNITDILFTKRGLCLSFEDGRIADVNTHGSGCTLSAAVAAHLARGEELEEAVALARRYLLNGMKHPIEVSGARFIAHLPGSGAA